MIRDPSDGSVKTGGAATSGRDNPAAQASPAGKRPTSAENWGLKSLDRPERKPKPAPTKEELAEHYAKHDLGFKLKEKAE